MLAITIIIKFITDRVFLFMYIFPLIINGKHTYIKLTKIHIVLENWHLKFIVKSIIYKIIPIE